MVMRHVSPTIDMSLIRLLEAISLTLASSHIGRLAKNIMIANPGRPLAIANFFVMGVLCEMMLVWFKACLAGKIGGNMWLIFWNGGII